MAGTLLAIADTTNVTKVGTWATNAGLSGNQYNSQAGDVNAYVQFALTGLTAGTPYSIATRWKLNITSFWTAVRVVLLDSDGTTVLKTTYIDQRYAPDAETISALVYRWIFNFTPSGTTGYVRIYGDNGATSNFVVAEAIYWQPWSDGLLSTPASLADGNWSDQQTWACGVVPTTQDTNRIYSTVSVAANASVGASGASGANSIVIKRDSGKLIINDGVTFTVKGGILYQQVQNVVGRTSGYYPLQVGQGLTGGAILEFDSTGSSGAASVYRLNSSATGQFNSIGRGWGVPGNPAVLRSKSGGANATIGDASFATTSGQFYGDYVNFLRLGSTTVPAIKAVLAGSVGATLRLVNCTFTDCGDNTVSVTCPTGGTNTVLTITDCTIESVVTANAYPFALLASGTGTGTWNIRRNWFDGRVDMNFQGAYASLSLEDNVYLKTFTYNNATSVPALDRGHLYFKDGIISNDVISAPSGSIANCYFLNDYVGGTESNPHFSAPSGTSTTYDSCVFDYIGDAGADIGDAMDNGTGAVTIKNSIILPSTASASVASGAIWQFSASSTGTLVLTHNTIFCSSTTISGLKMAHSASPGLANQIPSVKSNIWWATGSGVSAIRCDETSTVVQNMITPTGITNNNFFGLATFSDNVINGVSAQPLVGMSGLKVSTAPAAPSTFDPQFVDPSRNFLSWARIVRGKSGTNTEVRVAAMADIKADRTLTRTSALPHVFAGFAPTNAALATAGHDGATIGAVPYQAAATGYDKFRSFPRGVTRGICRGSIA